MIAQRRLGLGLVFLVVLGLSTAVNEANAEPLGRIDKVSHKSFGDTVKHLRWAMGGYGMTVAAAFDYQETLKKLKVETGRSVVIEVMRRPWLKSILDYDAAAGLEMPIRIYIYERPEGKTIVSYYKPSVLFGAYQNQALKELGRKLDEKLKAVVDAATF